MLNERRQHIRFKAFNSASVLVRSEREQVRGVLVDISKEGASFESDLAGVTLKNYVVDIISDNKNLHIEKIPCRTVFEIALYNENFTSLKMRRIGIKFEALTSTQFSDLLYFINEYLDYLAPASTIEFNPSLKGKKDVNKSGLAQSGQRLIFLNNFKKQRRNSRKPCEIAVNYATRAHALKDVIKNISLGGVYIETRMPLPVDQIISMKFQLPKSGKLINVAGKIVWADFPGIGVKFISTAAKDKVIYFNDLKKTKEIKTMGKIKKKRICWQPSVSRDVINYRLYWSNQEELNYNANYADVGNISEVILPDDVASFPLKLGKVEIGISAIDQAGNESDITKLSAYFNFSVPDAPLGLEIKDV